ncbi:MFS transporter [Comamonas flocculans]|uniref:MFS transporter n=1 Tax=Comamonas flocculans TaxID=2597701 RepID=A0A5B8RXF2_9BURK|nr:MFS transporter [Comamonas flocculans]QEA13298.1 MFS transporter [Comamonas flocculans]
MSASPAPAHRGWILAGLMAMMMLAAMDTTIVSTAIPQIVGDLGGLARVSWVFSIYLVAQTVTIPVYGKLSDLFGRKPVLMGGTLLFLLGSVACSAAWDMHALIAFRGLQGLGAGAIMATVMTLAGDLYEVRERGAVQGWLSSVWGVAAIAGPLLGGAFAEYASWRWIFLVNLPIGAVALVLVGRELHEVFQQRAARIDLAGAALLLLALGLLTFGVLEGGQSWPWASWQMGLVGALALLALAALVRVERRAAEPVLPGWLWRRRELLGSNLAAIGMGLVMMAPSIFLPTFLQAVQSQGAIAAGFVLAAVSMGWPAASALSPPLYARLGFRDTGLFGCLLIVLAALAFLAMPRPQPVALVFADQVLLGAGLGFFSTSILVGMQSCVDWGRRGVVTGSHMFSRYLGQSLGAALFGAIFNAALQARLAQAPAALRAGLPTQVDGVLAALQAPATPAPVAGYLRQAIGAATDALYLGMAVLALLMLLALLLAPRRFPVIDEGPKSSTTG